MSGLPTWRPGDTPNPGWAFYDGQGEPLSSLEIDQFVCLFKTEDDVELAKFSKSALVGYDLAVKTSEVVEVGKDAVDVYRFPIADTSEWPSSGKVIMSLKVRLASDVFEDGYRKVFYGVVAKLAEGDLTEI